MTIHRLFSKFRLNKIPLTKYSIKFSSTNQFQKFEAVNETILYEGHRPISAFQKGLLVIGSAVAGVTNPLRSDMVAALGETLFPECALRKIQLAMLNDETGKMILKEKPIIDPSVLDINKLISYPENSLGFAYASFMKENEITSDTRDPVHYIDDAELAYIMKRYRQIHDFVHLFLSMSVTVSHEVIVKWFEWAHFGLPMNMVSALFGPCATSIEERKEIQKYIPWAIYNGMNSSLILNVYYEKELRSDFKLLKKKLNIIDPHNFGI